MIKKIVFFCLLYILLTFSIQAQGFDAAGLSMGRAYGALATGVDAVAWNPANLILPRTNLFELNLVAFNLNIANSGFSPSDYDRYFTEEGHHGLWYESDLNAMMDLIGDELKIYGDINTNVIGLAFQNYALAIQGIGNLYMTIPRTPFELFFYGHPDKDVVQQFNDVKGNGYGALKVSFAAAYPVKIDKLFNTFGVGMNLNYYHGFQYIEITKGTGYFNTATDEIKAKVDFEGKKAEGGTGFGIDIGAAGVVDKNWTLSLALQNIYGSINWSENPELLLKSVRIDSGDLSHPDKIETVENDTTYKIDAFSKNLPVLFHFGASYKYGDNWIFSADLEQAYAKSMGYSDQGSLSVGAQYSPIPLLPIRSGITIGGKWGFLFGLGFGIHTGTFHFDLGYSMHRAMWPTLSTGTSLAMSTKLMF